MMTKMTKDIPLEIRIQVAIEAHYLVNHWGDVFPLNKETQEMMSRNERQDAVLEMAKPLVDDVLKTIKIWRQDGCPMMNDGEVQN